MAAAALLIGMCEWAMRHLTSYFRGPATRNSGSSSRCCMRVLVRYLKQLGREGTFGVVQAARYRNDALFVDQ